MNDLPRSRVGRSIVAAIFATSMLAGALACGAERRVIRVGEQERSFWVHRPPAADRAGGLVIVLHGSGGDGRAIRETLGRRLETFTDRVGFNVAYPDGYEGHWNDCRRSATYSANVRGIDDPAFLRAIVGTMREAAWVDPRRVFVVGFSNGGQMVFRLAFEDAATYAGFAAIAASLPAPANNDCQVADAPVPILLFAGTADPINPFRGGLVRVGNDVSRGHVLSAEYTASWFARRAGHAGPGVSTALPDRDTGDGSRASRLEWHAAGRQTVALYVLEGAAHTIPGSLGSPGSPAARPAVTNRDVDAAGEIWRFFEDLMSGPH